MSFDLFDLYFALLYYKDEIIKQKKTFGKITIIAKTKSNFILDYHLYEESSDLKSQELK